MFSGLALIRKDKPYVNDDPKIAKRNAAWDAVNAGKIDLALSSWSTSYVVHQPDLIHLVFRILKERNIDYIRAPYGAGAQVPFELSTRFPHLKVTPQSLSAESY